jgi:hypothetical protein
MLVPCVVGAARGKKHMATALTVIALVDSGTLYCGGRRQPLGSAPRVDLSLLSTHAKVTKVRSDTKGKFCLLLSRLQLLPRGIC